MKIIITGAAGFLGGRLTKYLAQFPEYEIVATSRRTHRAAELEAAGARFVPFQFNSQSFYRQLIEGTDAVVHCAALSSPWGAYRDFYDANVLLTQQLLDGSRAEGVRSFINISSPTVYNDYGDIFDAKETDPLPKPINHYSATKLLAEAEVQRAHSDKFRTLSFRPRAIIGAEDTVIFPRLMRAYAEGRLRMIGDGKNVVDFTAVENLCYAIRLALEAPDRAFGRTYNISNGQAEPLWKVINMLLAKLGENPVRKRIPYPLADMFARIAEWRARRGDGSEPALTRYGIAVLARSFTLDISAARKYLGYEPQVTTEEALDEFLEWHRQKAATTVDA